MFKSDSEIGMLHKKCDMLGNVIKLASERGYDTINFVSKIFNDEALSQIVVEGAEFEILWLTKLETLAKFKEGTTVSDFMSWFMGYTYMYWIEKYGVTPKEAYKRLPVEKFIANFSVYCTMSCNDIIRDLS